MTKNKSNSDLITEIKAAFADVRRKPLEHRANLINYKDDCQHRAEINRHGNPPALIEAQLHLSQVALELEEYSDSVIQSKINQEEEAYLATHGTTICQILSNDLSDRMAAKDSFLQNIGRRVSELSLEIFMPGRNREALQRERDAAEQSAADAEVMIQSAQTAIRRLEIEPSAQSLTAAIARVEEVTF